MYPEPTDSRPPLLYRETVHRPFETPGTLAGASAPQGEREDVLGARELHNLVVHGERLRPHLKAQVQVQVQAAPDPALANRGAAPPSVGICAPRANC